jgi:hypothetical protein
MTQSKNKKRNLTISGGICVLSVLSLVALVGCSNTQEQKNTDTSKTTPTETNSPDTKTDDSSSTDGGSTDSTIASWTEYKAYDGSYTVSFPEKPTEKKDYLQTAIGKVYFAEASYTKDKNYYSTSHTTYPVDPKKYDPEKGLDGSRDGISKSINMKIVREEKIKINGFPAREIEMKGKDGAVLAHLILDPNGPTLYQVFVVAGDGNVNTPENKAFLDSFSLKSK